MIPIACTKITETRRIVLIRRKTSLPRLIPSHLQAMYQRYVPLDKGARRRPLQTTSPPPPSRPPKSPITRTHNTPFAISIAPSYRPVLLDERSSICRYHPPILLRPASSSPHRHYLPEEDELYYIESHSEPAEKVECSDNTYDDQLDLSAVQALAQ